MQRHFNKILSFILVVSILIMTFLCFPLSAYATHGGGGGSNHGVLTAEEKQKRKQEILDNCEKYLLFLCSQVSAHVNGGGFKEYFENYVEYTKSMGLDLYLDDNISIEDNGDIDFSADLVSAIKQALREYSEETNGLYLAPTINVHDIPIEFFSSSYRYHSLVDIVDSLGLVGVAYNGSYIANLSIIHENGYSFVANVTSDTEQDLINSPLYTRGFYSNDSWGGPYGLYGGSEDTSRWDYGSVRCFSNIASERLTWDDGVYPLTMLNSPYRITGSLIFGYSNGKSQNTLGSYNPTSWSGYNAQYAVWSSDGRRVRVWKNETAFIYGTENRRTVYFGRDFYNSTPSQITVSVDDLNNSIEKLDTVLDKLLDKIDGNTEESKIEDILQDILDEIKGSGGGSGTGSGSGTGGSSAPSGWYESILAYLEGIAGMIAEGFTTLADQLDAVIIELGLIYESIGDMTEEEVSDKTDSMLSSLMSSFSEIGELLKGKFPFSIPWDFYSFLSLLAGDEVAVDSGQGVVMLSAYAGDYSAVPLTDDPEDIDQDNSGAPVFVIPFQISDEVGYPLIIDLEPFDPVSKISRSMLTVLFCMGLMHLTFKVISLGKELSDD